MQPFAASSIPLVTLGTFLLWFGWFGFNGFSQLAMGTFDDVNAIFKNCSEYTFGRSCWNCNRRSINKINW